VKPVATPAKIFSAILAVAAFSLALYLYADDPKFHNAPEEVINLKNPFAGRAAAAQAGGKLYVANCAICHGPRDGGNSGPRARPGASRNRRRSLLVPNNGQPEQRDAILAEVAGERAVGTRDVREVVADGTASAAEETCGCARGPQRKHHFAGAAKAVHGLPFRRARRQPNNYRRGFARGACDEVC
jgi:hypothetical protein